MFLFHVCKIGGNLDRKLFLQNWRALMLTSCAYRLSFICEVLAYNNTLYVCHHCVVIQCSAVFTVTLVTLQNMLAFQFKFYSYYLGFCSTPKFCQWIWRNPTDCAVVALLAKYRGSHILPCVCHLVQKKRRIRFFSSCPLSPLYIPGFPVFVVCPQLLLLFLGTQDQ